MSNTVRIACLRTIERMTYGHSLVIDPWGEELADGGDSPGVVFANLDLSKVAAVRAMLPSLTHDRPFAPPPECAGKLSRTDP
jgi:predicted amidohydrolase